MAYVDTQADYRRLEGSLKEFEVTEQHLTLLRNAYVSWNDCEFGAPEINPKRPYGNSTVIGDIAELLYPEVKDLDDDAREAFLDDNEDKLIRLHVETGIALEICLRLGTFKAGRYSRPSTYGPGWEPVPDLNE